MNINKLLWKLSVPAIAGMAVNALYNLVDAIFVGRGVSETAIGGLTIAFPIQMIVMAVGLMVGMGSASVFSRAYGEKDQTKMRHAVNTALRLNIILAAAFTLLGFLFLDPLLVLFGATTQNIDYAREYLSVIFIGLIPLSLTMVLNNLTRAEGRANVAMIAMFLGTGLNIILDPFFIYPQFLGMGMKGAAIATVISQIIAFVFIFVETRSKRSVLEIDLRDNSMPKQMVAEILAVGFPSFLRNSIGAIITIVVNNLIKFYVGDVSLASDYQSVFGIINRMLSFILMPSFGFVQGLAPIVGFNYGAKNYRRLHDAITLTFRIIFIYFIVVFLLVQLGAGFMFRLFVVNPSDLYIVTGANAFRLISVGFLLVGFQILISSVYQSEGFPLRATLVALSRQALFFLPMLFLFTSILGVSGIWWAFVSADISAGLLSGVLYFLELRRIHRLIIA